MKTKIAEFKGKAADGQMFTIYQFRELRSAGTTAAPPAPWPGVEELITFNDMRVQDNRDGT